MKSDGGRKISLLLGLDIGSSTVKASILDIDSGTLAASSGFPEKIEFGIDSPYPGWAEQDPELWWQGVRSVCGDLQSKHGVDLQEVRAVGISYQMHGLVIVDVNGKVLRPSIIWCDSRAVDIGKNAAETIGQNTCLDRLLNLPGNFTASKLRWVKENEPGIYNRIHKAMLPGDYIAYRLTGDIRTTKSGLSEGILWDFLKNEPSTLLLDHYEISPDLIAEITDTFGVQGTVMRSVADDLGLTEGTPVTYRAGDQSNNALSLDVLEPGEIAATAGTSGVIYGVTDRKMHDPESRVNTFIHVNNTDENPRNGVLLCVNGTGLLNRWLKYNVTGMEPASYVEMNKLAQSVTPGSDGLVFLPYGNGAERTLSNRDIGASLHNLDLNTHTLSHVVRAAQEGIVFALDYGAGILSGMGMEIKTVRVGQANMFLSPVFTEAFANTIGAVVELYSTDGSQGACRGAGIGAGIFKGREDAFRGLERVGTVEPDSRLQDRYHSARNKWLKALNEKLNLR